MTDSEKQTTPKRQLLVPVFRDKEVRGYPKFERGGRAEYMPSEKAFSKRFRTDAHFAAYCNPDVARRLATADAIRLLAPEGGVMMVWFVGDRDSPWHGVKLGDWTDEHDRLVDGWFQQERAKLDALEAAHPGMFVYRTRGGYRVAYALPAPFVLLAPGDALRWRTHYFRLICYLARAFDLPLDANCGDWTRLYRLPFVTRDGRQQAADTRGDSAQIGPIEYYPSDATLDSDLATARLLAEQAEHDDWNQVVKLLAPPEAFVPSAREPRVARLGGAGRPSLEERSRTYVARALEIACQELRTAPTGGRNDLLNKKGYSIGRYVGAGLIERSLVELALTDAARASGLDTDEVSKSLRSGLDAGIRSPKTPELRDDAVPFDEPPADHAGGDIDGDEQCAAQPDDEGEAGGSQDGGEWQSGLLLTEKGVPKANVANATLALEHAAGCRGLVAYDDLAERMVLLGALPSHVALTAEEYPRPWKDHDDILVAVWLQRAFGIDVNDGVVAKAAHAVAYHHRFHPVREYLAGLAWDGVERLPTWLTDHLGVADSAYVREVGTKWLISGVARIMRPGCKADCALVLEGLEGLKKSTALNVLGGRWFIDQLADMGTKDADEQLRGAWLVELAELSSMSRAEVNSVKAFLSRKTDRFRVSYGRHVGEYPRQCIFGGTTNDTAYLKGDSGNRRFWPVTCTKKADTGALAAVRDQLWAESLVRFARGEPWWIEDEEIEKLAKAEQDARYQPDAWEKPVADHLFGLASTTVGEVLSSGLRLEIGKWTPADQQRVIKCLQRLGWEKQRRRTGEGGKLEYRYYPRQVIPDQVCHVGGGGNTASPDNQAADPTVPGVPTSSFIHETIGADNKAYVNAGVVNGIGSAAEPPSEPTRIGGDVGSEPLSAVACGYCGSWRDPRKACVLCGQDGTIASLAG